jgi:hypothetical protein
MRVAISIATYPTSESKWSGGGGELYSDGAKFPSEVIKYARDGAPEEIVEIVERIGRLIDRLRPIESKLICLPEKIDHLCQAFITSI